MLISAPNSFKPLTIFGAVAASRLSTIIVGCSPFPLSPRKGINVSVPDMKFAINHLTKKTVINSKGFNSKLREKNYALFGIIGPIVAYLFIAVSIVLSPWFSWGSNALSDLGHSGRDVAPLFNFGLLLSGFCIILYAVTCFSKYAKYTSYMLIAAGLALQLVATFDEVYGSLHFLVSVLFFAALGFSSLTYVVEKKSVLAFAALIVGLVSWILYGLDVYSSGIAVPEFISSIAAVAWVMFSAFKIYFGKD